MSRLLDKVGAFLETERKNEEGCMSKLITARSNFALETVTKSGKCRGCKVKIEAGERVYVSRYTNPNNRRQNCVALLCNLEECWQEWDAEVFVKAGEQFDEEAA